MGSSYLLKGIGADKWRWMLGLGAIPGVLLAVGMLFMPYSPRWLAEHGREEEAREALCRTHREDEVDEELKSIKEVASREAAIRDLFGSAVRRMLVVGLGLAIFQQQTVFIGVTNVTLAALVLSIASFAMGLGPVFWLMISEIFPLELRGPAMALCTVANWGFNFIVSFTFLSLVGGLGKAATFWLYAVIGVVAVVFFAKLVPETAGRSLEEIQQDFSPRGRARKRFGRHSPA